MDLTGMRTSELKGFRWEAYFKALEMISSQSGNLVISGILVTGLIAFMFVHPYAVTTREQIIPLLTLIVGHYFGQSAGRDKGIKETVITEMAAIKSQ